MEIHLGVIFIMGAFISVEGKLKKCDKKIDLAVVLDASASVGEENFNLAKQFAKELLRRFSLNKDKTRVSLVTYSQYVNIKPWFKDFYDQKEIEETLDNTRYEGSATRTAKALTVLNFEVFAEKSGARLKRPGVKDAMVIVSDGFSSIGIEGMKEKTDIAKHAHMKIYAVGITGKIKKAELRVMASKPIDRHFFRLKRSQNIKRIVNRIVKDLCRDF